MTTALMDPKPLVGEPTVNERVDVVDAPVMDSAVRGLVDTMLSALERDMGYLSHCLPDGRYAVTYESGARLRLDVDGGDLVLRFTHA
jgi:hypothetical protein